jgi:ABC-type transport system substrate-binding protein
MSDENDAADLNHVSDVEEALALFSRRDLLGKALRTAGAAAALSAGGLFAGGSEAGAGATRSVGAGARLSAPRRGGTLILGSGSGVSRTFDPPVEWATRSWIGGYAIFNRLLSVVGKTPLEPELLVQMPTVSRGGTHYSFQLRKGVKFHHGRELIANDVKYTLERLLNPASGSGGASLYAGLTILGMQNLLNQRSTTLPGIKVTGKYTFTIDLEKPDSVFLYLLALNFTSIVPQEVVQQLGANWGLAPVGTGPFKLTSADLAKGYTFDRNPNYWKPAVPYVDSVRWNLGIDPTLSILRIENGQQDLMVEPVPAASLDQINGQPSLLPQLYVDLYNNTHFVTLPLSNPSVNNLKVRQAIALAIDKVQIVRTIKGLGLPADGGLLGPLSPFYQKGLAYPNDMAKAQALMKSSGVAPFSLDLYGTSTSPFIEIGAGVQSALKQLGIQVNLKLLSGAAYASAVDQNPPLPAMVMNSWSLPYPHGSYLFDGGFTQAALDAKCCNHSDFVNPSFERLLASAHSATDPKQINTDYRKADRTVVRDLALWVPIIYPKLASFISKRVGGFGIAPGPIINVKFLQRYWLTS